MIMASALNMPSGFRFHPTDEELVRDYLVRKCAGLLPPAPVIAEVDLYQWDPWKLPEKALYGEEEWYFFSPRDRKYPNGMRPSRTAGIGYWKATGADKPIGQPTALGIKKSLVFFAGKSPQGFKTNWIMHEYRLANVDRSLSIGRRNKLRLDDWVLCRIYNKKGIIEKYTIPKTNSLQVQQVYENNEPRVLLEFGMPFYPQSEPMSNCPPPMDNNCLPLMNNCPPVHSTSNEVPHIMETLGIGRPKNNEASPIIKTLDSVPKLQGESSGSGHVNSPLYRQLHPMNSCPPVCPTSNEVPHTKEISDFVWQKSKEASHIIKTSDSFPTLQGELSGSGHVNSPLHRQSLLMNNYPLPAMNNNCPPVYTTNNQGPHIMETSALGRSMNDEAPHIMENSDSVPKLQGESSGSEHVNSPDLMSSKEVQSETNWEEFHEQMEDFDPSMLEHLWDDDDDFFGTKVLPQMDQGPPLPQSSPMQEVSPTQQISSMHQVSPLHEMFLRPQ